MSISIYGIYIILIEDTKKQLYIGLCQIIYNALKENNNACIPMLEPDVIDTWKKIPPKFKHDCIIQKAIIKYYYPSLMEFPFTKSYVTHEFKNKFNQIKKKFIHIIKQI